MGRGGGRGCNFVTALLAHEFIANNNKTNNMSVLFIVIVCVCVCVCVCACFTKNDHPFLFPGFTGSTSSLLYV